ncbi:MAG TPA: hypothetical protein VGI81_26300 [Tepidisphaeraceae bacterium]|jgi:hypothetical protein
MNEQPEQPPRPVPSFPKFGIGTGTIGLFGLFLIPIALVVYAIALPLFGLFWLIEWLLPLHPADRKTVDDQFRGMEVASPPKHD